MEAMDVMKDLSSALLIIIASLCYCYFIYSKLPKGIFRVISFIPVFCIFTNLPFHICSTYATFAISAFITWICNFKLLLLAFDQGPLSCQRSKLPLLTFITIASLSIKIEENKCPPEDKKVSLNLAIYASLFALIAELMIHYKGRLRPGLMSILYCIYTFLLVENLSAWCCWIGRSITGLELDKPSNNPYLTTSLQDFWGRRWNIPISNTLRHTIYFPVRTASEKVIGKGLFSTCLGVMATFTVSGLMHELIYYHMMLAATSWQVALCFVIQGVAVSTEIVLKKRFKDKLRLPWFVSGPLTIGFVVMVSWRWHFSELIRIGLDVRLLEEYQLCVEYLKSKLLDLWPFSVPGVSSS